ncbi:unnamed protein product [Sympodiomycopsis kandeliae]
MSDHGHGSGSGTGTGTGSSTRHPSTPSSSSSRHRHHQHNGMNQWGPPPDPRYAPDATRYDHRYGYDYGYDYDGYSRRGYDHDDYGSGGYYPNLSYNGHRDNGYANRKRDRKWRPRGDQGWEQDRDRQRDRWNRHHDERERQVRDSSATPSATATTTTAATTSPRKRPREHNLPPTSPPFPRLSSTTSTPVQSLPSSSASASASASADRDRDLSARTQARREASRSATAKDDLGTGLDYDDQPAAQDTPQSKTTEKDASSPNTKRRKSIEDRWGPRETITNDGDTNRSRNAPPPPPPRRKYPPRQHYDDDDDDKRASRDDTTYSSHRDHHPIRSRTPSRDGNKGDDHNSSTTGRRSRTRSTSRSSKRTHNGDNNSNRSRSRSHSPQQQKRRPMDHDSVRLQPPPPRQPSMAMQAAIQQAIQQSQSQQQSESDSQQPQSQSQPVPTVVVTAQPPQAEGAQADEQDSSDEDTDEDHSVPRTYAPPRGLPIEMYTRIAQVGQGTYGQVFKARSEYTGVFVALKKIKMEAEKDGFPITAMREIKLLQMLRHPNVVRLHEMMTARTSVYMVLEYMEHDLNGVLNHPDIHFSPAHLKSLASQLLQGLDYLHHKSVLHRDLKGSNILLNNAGLLKLADFGLARLYSKRRQEEYDYTNRVVTLWYRPPELLLGESRYNDRVDIWGAGCIFLELFTRKPVFCGTDEIDQLSSIIQVMGPFDEKRWRNVAGLPWFELIRPSTGGSDGVQEDWDVKFRDKYTKLMSPAALDLAQALLTLDPACRVSASQALQMRYFTKEKPRAVLPRKVLSGIKGEWHELESRRARQRAR